MQSARHRVKPKTFLHPQRKMIKTTNKARTIYKVKTEFIIKLIKRNHLMKHKLLIKMQVNVLTLYNSQSFSSSNNSKRCNNFSNSKSKHTKQATHCFYCNKKWLSSLTSKWTSLINSYLKFSNNNLSASLWQILLALYRFNSCNNIFHQTKRSLMRLSCKKTKILTYRLNYKSNKAFWEGSNSKEHLSN